MPDKNGYSSSYDEAEKKYNAWKSKDPLPRIAPALLNSADIADYVKVTGMIYPFHEEDLKGATYTIRLKGMCVCYEQFNNKQKVFCVGADGKNLPNSKKNKKNCEIKNYVELEPNSITFVTLEPVLQVPDYMVFRFNLKISQVYKGLLLGTGPVIDPGFQGRLSIPLHNLTSNKYTFYLDDELISLEVTKMSQNNQWLGFASRITPSPYIQNKIRPHRQVIDYIDKALKPTGHKSIVSSVVAATNDIKRIAEIADEKSDKAIETADNINKTVNIWGLVDLFITVAIICITLFTIILPTFQLVESVNDTQAEYEVQIQRLQEDISELNDKIKLLTEDKN